MSATKEDKKRPGPPRESILDMENYCRDSALTMNRVDFSETFDSEAEYEVEDEASCDGYVDRCARDDVWIGSLCDVIIRPGGTQRQRKASRRAAAGNDCDVRSTYVCDSSACDVASSVRILPYGKGHIQYVHDNAAENRTAIDIHNGEMNTNVINTSDSDKNSDHDSKHASSLEVAKDHLRISSWELMDQRMAYFYLRIQNSSIEPDALENVYRNNYIEGLSMPRRFLIDLTGLYPGNCDSKNELIGASVIFEEMEMIKDDFLLVEFNYALLR